MAKRIISMAGHRGAGTSVLASYLAAVIAEAGRRVVLVDRAEAPEQHARWGVIPSRASILFDLPGTLMATALPGLRIGQLDGREEDPAVLSRFGVALRSLDADAVVVDAGSCATAATRTLFDLASCRVIVTQAEPDAIAATYALAKSAVMRRLRALAAARDRLELVSAAPGAADPKVPALMAQLRTADPQFAAALQASLDGWMTGILLNQADDAQAQGALAAITRMIRDFVGVSVAPYGILRRARAIASPMSPRGQPYVSVRSDDAQVMRDLARGLLSAVVSDEPVTVRVLRGDLAVEILAAAKGEAAPGPPSGRPVEAPRGPRWHEVRWPARVAPLGAAESEAARTVAVWVREISLAGALVELPESAALDQLRLTFEGLPQQPMVSAAVSSVSEGGRRVRVEFTAPASELPADLQARLVQDDREPIAVPVERLLDRVATLPTLSMAALQLGQLVDDPSAGADRIAGTLRQDASLSAAVLKLVNSSFYAVAGGVTDISRAITIVGVEGLHRLALSLSVIQALRTPAGSSFDSRGLWLHAYGVALCAEAVAQRIGHASPGTCFTAGLLHDIGKVALAITEPDRFGAAIDRVRWTRTSMRQEERMVGLPSHDLVGGHLALRWHLPRPLTVPIRYHHEADDPHLRRELAPALLAVVDIVALADRLGCAFAFGDGGSPAADEAELAPEAVGLALSDLPEIRATVTKKIAGSVFLRLLDDQLPAPRTEPSRRSES